MDLKESLKIIKKRRRFILIFASAVFLFVLAVTFLMTPQFQGTTKVIIEAVEPNNFTSATRTTSRDPDFIQTQFQLIKSLAVATRVEKMLSLSDTWQERFGEDKEKTFLAKTFSWIKGIKKQIWAKEEETSPEKQQQAFVDGIISQISQNVIVQPVTDSRIVNIGFQSPDPEFAALVANTVIRAYIDESLDLKVEASRRVLEWMTTKAETQRTKLEAAEKSLQAFTGDKDILTLENRIAVTPQKLSEISTRLVGAEARRKEVEALYNQIKVVRNDPAKAETVPAVMSDPTLQILRSQIVTAEKSIMELSGKYGPKHPVMNKARGDLYVLRRKRVQEINRVIQSIENEYKLAVSVEEGLKEQFDTTKAEVHALNKNFMEYETLKRDVATYRQLYDALMLKIKEQGINETSQPVSVLIVEEAKTPLKPVKPVVPLNILLGLFVAVVGGIGFGFLVDYLDSTIRGVDETEMLLGTPVLGVISSCNLKGLSPEKVVLAQPTSPLSESYRALRTAVLLSSEKESPKRVLITSSVAGEGKTTISVNLAITLAQSERSVLLIDGDLRKPRIHKILGLSNEKGLSTYLSGATDADILQKGPYFNLSILTAGPTPFNPSELLMSKTIKNLLNVLSAKFDIIICDTSPILVVSDAHHLSNLFDGTILVAKARMTKDDMARKSLKLLKSVGGKVLGMVINAQGEHDEGYGYYHREYYGVSDDDEDKGIGIGKSLTRRGGSILKGGGSSRSSSQNTG